MAVREIKSAQDLAALRKKRLALVDFNAPWCAPCSLQAPIIRRIADQYAGRACVATINIDERSDFASELGIRFIPTLIFFKNNKEVKRLTGLQPEHTISEVLDRFLL